MPLTHLKALAQLGIKQTSLFAWYRWGLKSGYLRWRTKSPHKTTGAHMQRVIDLPDPEQLRSILGAKGLSWLTTEAEEILSGKVRLFGGEPVELVLDFPGSLKHWTDYRVSDPEFGKDIKFTWEPGRFGWAITLARAYFFSQDERFAACFWENTEKFWTANPTYLGPHWMSAQEAAIRLTSLVFAYQIFASSPLSTPERVSRLAESIAQHANRIPPTLTYARAQNNNHLLTEAMGLITAAVILPNSPAAPKWHAIGWKWFHQGLLTQITAEGEYIQHSTNYHRLMLQTALWVFRLAHASGEQFPKGSLDRLAAATRWLFTLLDPVSGCVPNLGPNDGAYIFPLSIQPFCDFRPALQAAGVAFLGQPLLTEGTWDEMSWWLCPISGSHSPTSIEDGMRNKLVEKFETAHVSPNTLSSSILDSWAYLRAAHFTSRPGHADQLHLDLWWRGLNIAQDPGTYLYNSPAPWNNVLTSTFVHNTVTINGQEQMKRHGRFLYLDWAQGDVISSKFDGSDHPQQLTAQHDGYRHLGITHQRTVRAVPNGWLIKDQLIPRIDNLPQEKITARLHWLLPDWEWKLNTSENKINLELLSPLGWMALKITGGGANHKLAPISDLPMLLVRAGQVIFPKDSNEEANPTWGWTSPTYGVKLPALSFSVRIRGILPLSFTTNWKLNK
jgi:hypothetical protein